MKNKDDIPFSNKPWDPETMTYDQIGELLGKTLSKVHKEEMDKIKIKKQKNKKK